MPLIACAVISGALLLVLLAKVLAGAQAWPSLPSELYWLASAAFAIASAISRDTHGVMPLVVASFFAVACMLAGYRWWILCYPGVAALLAAFAACASRPVPDSRGTDTNASTDAHTTGALHTQTHTRRIHTSHFCAVSIHGGSEACIIGAGWGAVVGALMCMLARALTTLHHFRFVRGEKECVIV